MLLAVFMTAFETSYVLPENAAVKTSIQKKYEYADKLRRAQWRRPRAPRSTRALGEQSRPPGGATPSRPGPARYPVDITADPAHLRRQP